MSEFRRVTQFEDGWDIEEKYPYIAGKYFEMRWVRRSQMLNTSEKPYQTKEEAEAQVQKIEQREKEWDEFLATKNKTTTPMCSWLEPWGVGKITSRLDKKTGSADR